MAREFSFRQIINTYDSTPDYRISPVSILRYFQEAAQRDVEALNVGTDYMKKNNFIWILIKYEIEFFEYPKTGEEVTITTQAVGINRFEAYRKFTLESETGETLVTGKSTWMILNTKTGKIVRISNVPELQTLKEEKNTVYRLPKFSKVENYDSEEEFTVRYLDIDVNKHTNNVNYLIWAIESLPWEAIENFELEKLKMVFKEQSFYNQKITSRCVRLNENTWRIDLYNQEETLICQVELVGRERSEKFSEG